MEDNSFGVRQPRKSSIICWIFSSVNEYPRNILKDQVTKTAHTRPLTTSYPVLSKEFSSAMQDIRTGADVKSALDKVVQRFEEDIKRNN